MLFDADGEEDGPTLNDAELESNVREILERLSGKGFIAGNTLARDMDVDPWDVLNTCKMLCRRGLIIEGRRAYRGHFRLR